MAYENLQGDIGSSSGQAVKGASSGATSPLVLTTGNVGIGTTTPQKKLDVVGEAIVRNATWQSSSDQSTLCLGDSNQTVKAIWGSGLAFGTYPGNAIMFQDSNAKEYMRVNTANGNVGIGCTNPQDTFSVANKIMISSANPPLPPPTGGVTIYWDGSDLWAKNAAGQRSKMTGAWVA